MSDGGKDSVRVVKWQWRRRILMSINQTWKLIDLTITLLFQSY